MALKAIIFDSSMVLSYPRTGNWYLSPTFFRHIDRRVFSKHTSHQLQKGFAQGSLYVEDHLSASNIDDEIEIFSEFYRILLSYLPLLQISENTIRQIAVDFVSDSKRNRFYRDVYSVIPELRKMYKLAVIADGWPSWEDTYAKAGLRDYFSSFVLSCHTGVLKPSRKTFDTALEEMSVLADEVLYVDDSLMNCQVAESMGMIGNQMCRNLQSFLFHRYKLKRPNVFFSLRGFEAHAEQIKRVSEGVDPRSPEWDTI